MAKDIPELHVIGGNKNRLEVLCEDGCPFARCERNTEGVAADLCFMTTGQVVLRLKRHLSEPGAIACQWWQRELANKK